MLIGPLLLVARRWSLPFGLAGGLAFDTLHALVRVRSWRLRLAAFGGPATLFTGYLLMAEVDGEVRWPPEIWGGLVCLAGFVGLGLVLLQESGTSSDPSEVRSTGR